MRIWVLLLAVLAAITLQGCGNGAQLEDVKKATVVQLVEVKATSSDQVSLSLPRSCPRARLIWHFVWVVAFTV